MTDMCPGMPHPSAYLQSNLSMPYRLNKLSVCTLPYPRPLTLLNNLRQGVMPLHHTTLRPYLNLLTKAINSCSY